MTKLDMVIRGLEECTEIWNCRECEYGPGDAIVSCRTLLTSALELLKKQQAVEPKVYGETRYSGPVFACGDCHHALETAKQKFCPFCGKPVKWKNEETAF